jgi:hypothetical protein
MLDNLERLRNNPQLLQLFSHYARLGETNPEAWRPRLMVMESDGRVDLVKLHGELRRNALPPHRPERRFLFNAVECRALLQFIDRSRGRPRENDGLRSQELVLPLGRAGASHFFLPAPVRFADFIKGDT